MFVDIDKDEVHGAFDLAGRYRQLDQQVQVNVLLSQGDAEVASFRVSGVASNLTQLAAEIVSQAQARLDQLKSHERTRPLDAKSP